MSKKLLLAVLLAVSCIFRLYPADVQAENEVCTLTLNGNGKGEFMLEHGWSPTYQKEIPKGEFSDVGIDPIPYSSQNVVFAGWSYTPNGHVDIYKDNLYGMRVNEDTTLYAVWGPTVALTLDANGHGTVGSDGKEKEVYYIPGGEPCGIYWNAISTSDDLTFAGWSSTPDGDIEIPMNELNFASIPESMTLYAVWRKACRVTLHANGNGRFFAQYGYGYADTYELIAPENGRMFSIMKPHDIFDQSLVLAGWSYTPYGDVDVGYFEKINMTATESFDLYAVWRPYYEITLNAGEGYFPMSTFQVQTFKAVSGIGVESFHEPVTDNAGSTFIGWSRSPGGKAEFSKTLEEYVPVRNETLYAVWEPAYTITFKTTEGYFAEDLYTQSRKKTCTQKPVAGEAPELPVTWSCDSGRTVAGWSFTKDGPVDLTNEELKDFVPAGNTTLYAVWTDGWTVTLEANGGSFPSPNVTLLSSMTFNTPDGSPLNKYTKPEHPEKIFIGYGTERNSTPINLEELPITSDVTLYAQWIDVADCRLAGADRFDTSIKIAEAFMQEKKIDKLDSVILANGIEFADALAGSYLSYVKDAPILITWEGFEGYTPYEQINKFINANVKEGGTVYVLGGETAVPPQTLTGLEKFNINRLAGDNRFETNLKILEETKVSDQDILVATGMNFADSLSASAVNRPILLVWEQLFDMQKDYLKTLKGNDYYLLGGEKAVTPKIANELSAYGKVTRLAGSDRHETSVLIAETFCPDAESAVLALSTNFPDGLCGGPLASATKAPLILTIEWGKNPAAEYCRRHNITHGFVLGGTSLISNKTCIDILSK